MRTLKRNLLASTILLTAYCPVGVSAQQSTTLEEISVVSTTPIGAAPRRRADVAPSAAAVTPEGVTAAPQQSEGVERAKLPYNTAVLTSRDISRVGAPDLLRALDESNSSININNSQNNPFAPAVTYRGFEASPLGGSPQGLAVYVNGARFNQAFGDTVNWDLIPSIAIDRVVLEGSNPAFGLNALGGSLAVTLKNGFTYQGTEIAAYGGSFGRGAVQFQHGQISDNFSLYVAGNALSEEGWREHSPSRLRQFYGDFGMRSEGGEYHLNVIAARSALIGNGTTPVELLAVDRNAVFSYPDATRNTYSRGTFSGTQDITPTISLQGNAYYGVFKQRTFNGDAAEVEPCDDNPAILCSEDGGPLRNVNTGGTVSSVVNTANFNALPGFQGRYDDGGPYFFLNRTSTNTESFGTTVQTTITEPLFGLPNRFVFGGSYDGGRTRFSASSEVGGQTFDRGYAGPGTVIATDDGSISPVNVSARNDYGGIYFSNITDVTDKLAVTLTGRQNFAQINLRDQIGTALNGEHSFQRFNPGIGAAYKILPGVSLYGGYVEANRAPTPAELSCADPGAPCSLTNFFVGDPPLRQVVTRTIESGLRGSGVIDDVGYTWHAGYFHARNDDDILFVSSDTVGRAFFRNVGSTQRQGAEAGVTFATRQWTAFLDYTFTDATFRTPLTLNSPLNPSAVPADPDNDDSGVIQVRKGNTLPGVPAHQVKLGVQYFVTPEWKVGALMRYASGKFLVGDESNLNKTTGDYAVFGFNMSYYVTPHFEVFGYVENAFNAKYATFGTFSPTNTVAILGLPNASVTRALSPGAPVAGFGGVRVTW